MKLTIAFDDLSLPLPTMKPPDIRGRIIEHVLTMAAEAGVDDVELIAALALHRRMTAAELKHIVGERVFHAFYPQGKPLQPRRRGPRQPLPPRHHREGRGGRDQQAGRRVRPARLRQHQPRGDGRRPQVGRPSGWRPTSRCGTTTTPRRWCSRSRSWTSSTPRCTTPPGGSGKVIKDSVQGLPDRDDAQQRHVRPKPYDFLQKREWEWSLTRPGTMLGDARGAVGRPAEAARTRSSTTCGRLTALTQVSAPARSRRVHEPDARERATSSTSSRWRARPTSSRWGSRTSAPTT